MARYWRWNDKHDFLISIKLSLGGLIISLIKIHDSLLPLRHDDNIGKSTALSQNA